MLKEEIEKTLQDHAPQPSDDFAERIDGQVVALIQAGKGPGKKVFRPRLQVLAAAAAVVLLLGGVVLTSGGGWPDRLMARPDVVAAQPTEPAEAASTGPREPSSGLTPEAADDLERYCPVAKDLVPLNISTEKDGIRFELISAVANEEEAWFVYSFQDLTGDRVNERSYFYGNGNIGQDISKTVRFSVQQLDCIEDEARIIFCSDIHYSEPDGSADRVISFGLGTLYVCQSTKLDLMPYFRLYGETAQAAADLPQIKPQYNIDYEPIFTEDDCRELGLRVLDWTHPLDVSLCEGLELTGIGIVDGYLHVQLYYPDNKFRPRESDVWYTPLWGVSVSLPYYQGISDRNSLLPPEANPVRWDDPDAEGAYFEEYVLYMPYDDSPIRLTAASISDAIDGLWLVDFPLQEIWKGIEGYSGRYTDEFFAANLKYTLQDDGTAMIVESPEYAEWRRLSIPAELDGHPVTAIGSRAFANCSYVKSVTVPEGIVSIGDKAFSFCTSLSRIRLPETLESIGDDAFFYTQILDSVASAGGDTLPASRIGGGCTVTRGSYAMEYCIRNGIRYVFADEENPQE